MYLLVLADLVAVRHVPLPPPVWPVSKIWMTEITMLQGPCCTHLSGPSPCRGRSSCSCSSSSLLCNHDNVKSAPFFLLTQLRPAEDPGPEAALGRLQGLQAGQHTHEGQHPGLKHGQSDIITWRHMETHDTLRQHRYTGTHGDKRRHMGTNEDTWRHMEAHGAVMKTQGYKWRLMYAEKQGDTLGHMR